MITKKMAAEFDSASKILVAFSSGKDSTAMLLLLLELGYKSKIEVWHHEIDPDGVHFFDYPCTSAYTKALCEALDVPLYFSHKVGGFLGELNRKDAPTAAVAFQTETGEYQTVGGKGPRDTRQQFPAIHPSLSIRYCSPYLKIDVMKKAIVHQERFQNSHTVVVTGERAAESKARAKYAEIQPHATNAESRKKRKVTHIRPILRANTAWVWQKLRDHGVVCHPSYSLGLGRCSCQFCLFLNVDDLATVAAIDPAGIQKIADLERQFNHTIYYDSKLETQLTIADRAAMGTPHPFEPIWGARAMSTVCDWDVIVPKEEWKLPLGAKTGSLLSGSP